MKFLCDNCKAKYQLSDDKVAGRAVRMKCRKCGHLIEVAAQGAEHLADPSGDAVVAESVPPAEGTSASSALSPAQPAGARPPPPPRRSQTQTKIGLPKAPPPPKPPPPKPPSPRPSSSKAAAPPPPPPKKVPSAPKPTGLAGAFSKAVAAAPSSGSAPSGSATSALAPGERAEEWYVGIGGAPVGPIPLAEVRAKAEEGAVTLDSLVWRDGLAEWAPLRSHPELAAMVSEATKAERPAPAPAPLAPASSRPSTLRSVGSTGARPAPPPRPPAPRTNVVPIASRLATAAKLDDPPAPVTGPQPVSVPSDPPDDDLPPDEDVTVVAAAALALPALASPAAAPAVAAAVAPVAAPPVAPPPAAVPVASPAPVDHDDSILLPKRRKRSHPAAWAVVGLAGVLGGIFLGLSLAGKPKPEVQVVTVPQPTVTADVPPPPTAEPTSTGTTIDTVAVKPSAGGGGTGTAAKGSTEAKGPAPVATQPSGGTGPASGLAGLSGLTGGPSVKPPTGPGPSGGGGTLAQADIERVVQSHRAFVKRQCWESALAGKSANAPSSARVSVSLSIASDGRVTSANASGGDGYPGLASCVQNQVRSWRFPASDGASVSVPFVFAAQ